MHIFVQVVPPLEMMHRVLRMTAHRLVVLKAMAWAQQQVQSPEQRWHKLLRREKGRLLTGGRYGLPVSAHQDKRLYQAWLEIAQSSLCAASVSCTTVLEMANGAATDKQMSNPCKAE